MTLTKDNSKLSNAPFKDKQEIYKNSNYAITRELVNYKDWSSEEIKERSRLMAKQALSLWPLPDNYNTPSPDDPVSKMTADMDEDTYQLFNDLRDAIKNSDAAISEEIKKLYINYIKNKKVYLSIIPWQKSIDVTFKAESSKGHWGSGKSRFKVSSPDDILQVIDYVRQMNLLNII